MSSPKVPVVIRYNDGTSEVWAFEATQAARVFIQGLYYHPLMKRPELSPAEDSLTFGFSEVDTHSAAIEEDAEILLSDGSLLQSLVSGDAQFGEFDDTALPLGGLPAQLVEHEDVAPLAANPEAERLEQLTMTLR